MKNIIFFFVSLIILSCNNKSVEHLSVPNDSKAPKPIIGTSLVILGTIQDAGSPHIGCNKDCCAVLFDNPDPNRKVVSLGLIDPQNKKTFLFEATPDIASQLKKLKEFSPSKKEYPAAVFLTHAHIGHYTGLMYFGKEATNAKQIPIFTMPRMMSYLEENGPWSQLVTNNNISLNAINDQQKIEMSSNIQIVPFLVPHRDEYSETVGYKIIGPNKSALFIPDIDKWGKWKSSIIDAISEVDFAFLDATFYDSGEINNRDISLIPHPFVIESMKLFKELPTNEKKKIHFIHFNHTNPVITIESDAYNTVVRNGFNIAQIDDVFPL